MNDLFISKQCVGDSAFSGARVFSHCLFTGISRVSHKLQEEREREREREREKYIYRKKKGCRCIVLSSFDLLLFEFD